MAVLPADGDAAALQDGGDGRDLREGRADENLG